jgi:hypothetical protein
MAGVRRGHERRDDDSGTVIAYTIMRKNIGENTDYITKNGESNMERGVHSKSPANVTQYLSGVRFPCRKQNLIDHARHQGADAEVLERLRDLSEAEYHTDF